MRSIRKIYGPYVSKKDQRKRVVIHYHDGTNKVTSYARHLMEQHLGRELTSSETVDHRNEDKTDDRIDNYQILSRPANIIKSATEKLNSPNYTVFNCLFCGEEATKRTNQVRHNRKMGKAGPFCGRSCAGRYSSRR